jgi:hypothetical protein|tara:strand:- start:817 stop:1029 length:213 start_codon:yes stop_codon:yes gene_type:complete
MEYAPLIEALSFLIKALVIGGVTGVVLALIGVVPVLVTKQVVIFTKDEREEVLKKMQITLGDLGEEEEDY